MVCIHWVQVERHTGSVTRAVPSGSLRIKFHLLPCFLALLLGVAGCNASTSGSPPLSLVPDRDIDRWAVDRVLTEPAIVTATSPGATKVQRNAIIFARLLEIDRLYYTYESALDRELRGSAFGLSLAQIVVGAAGTFAGTGLSQILSAGSAGLAGIDAAYTRDFLVEKTTEALTSQMRANRARVKAQIFEKSLSDINIYPTTAALSDLVIYYHAGTLQAAIRGISVESQAAAQDANASLRETEQRVFGRTAADLAPTARITKAEIISRVKDPTLVSDQQILALANAPPGGGQTFTTRLALLRSEAGGTFSNADSARIALSQTLNFLDGSNESLTAWQRAMGLF